MSGFEWREEPPRWREDTPKKKTPFGVFISMGRGKDSVQKLTKCQVLNGGKNHHGGKKTPPKKRLLSESLLVWAGVDSNHRSLATADLQSAPFSHSGTYPFKLPLTGLEPVTSPLPRECATTAPQRHLS